MILTIKRQMTTIVKEGCHEATGLVLGCGCAWMWVKWAEGREVEA